MKNFYLYIYLFFFINAAHSLTITSIASGSWAAPGTWSTGTVPGSGDDVTVAAAHTITMNGNSGNCLSLTVNGKLNWTSAFTTNIGAGGLTLNNGSTVSSGILVTGVLTVNGPLTVPTGASATVAKVALTVTGNTSISGTIIFSNTGGTKTFANVTINSGATWNSTAAVTENIGGDLTMLGGSLAASATPNLTVSGNFNITSGTNTMSRCQLIVTGATNISSILNVTNTAGGKTLNDVVISSSGNLNCTVAEAWAILGNFTNNGTFTANTGTYTFSGAAKIISGTATSTFGTLSCTGSLTNNGIVTINTALSGAGSWTQGSGTLNIAATNANFSVTPFDASGAGNTVNYTRAGNQNVRNGTGGIYNNLGLTGSGTKSLTAATTCNGNVTISSTFDVTATNYALNIGGNWLNTGTFTARTGTVTFNGTTAQSITNAAGETFNNVIFSNAGTKTQQGNFTAKASVTINAGSGALIGNGYNILCGKNWLDNSSYTCGTGTVTFNGTTAQTISKAGGETFNNLIFSGAGTKTMLAAITANGNITINAGSGALIASNFNISVAGNWSNSATFTPGTNTVTFNGTAAQTIGGTVITAFHSLTISNSAGITLSKNTTVATTLAFTAGVITTGANKISILAGGTVSGAGTSKFVNGTLEKNIATGAGVSRTYEIGNGATDYLPVNIVFTSVTVAGNLAIIVQNGDHPNIATSCVDALKSVNRYWQLTNTGITFTNYSITCNFIGVPTDADAGSTPTNYFMSRFSGGVWAYQTQGSAGATSNQGTGITGMGDLAIGEKRPPLITVQPISAAFCNASNGSFSVTATGITLTYQWQVNIGAGFVNVVNGGVYAGATTAALTITPVSLAMNNYLYQCIISSTCGTNVTTSVATLTVTPTVAASVSIAASPAGAICSGTNVTFTATPVNGGAVPSYQWKIGAANVGTNSATYSNAALANGNVVSCVMTSNATCPTGNPATSNSITMTVNPNLPVSVSIAAVPAGAICAGTNVVFTATPTNGGAAPSYQWQLNGINVGSNSTSYSNAALANGDIVTCILTSNAVCPTGNPATSNSITMTVNPILPVSASIAVAPSNTICAGTSVTFTCTPTNGGAAPSYQWKKNGTNVGTNSSTYTNAALTNGNTIICVVTSNATCPSGNPATSNTITMTVNPNLAASISIARVPAGAICAGTNVVFTATPTNGGATPSYQWTLNGVNAGTNSTTYSNSALANGDVVNCIMTSNATCATGNPATSNNLTMTVNPNLPVSVSISASPPGGICSGTSVTFTAVPTNGGAGPSYQWKKNGTNVGANSTTYTNAALVNGDVITCVLTSNATCATGNPATSNSITMVVGATLPASVSIAAGPAGAICSGTSVTFTATPTNGGAAPAYQWKKNGANVGSNSTTYTNAALINGDIITCVMTSNLACATGNPATSNSITMTVNANVAASVAISASPAGAVCSGTNVTFTAVPTGGGAAPVYQWKLNGTNVGSNSTTYSNAGLVNGDIVTCVMTSNATCATPNPSTSNSVTMTVNPNLPASVSIAAAPSTTICTGTNVTFTATPTNGGAGPTYQWKLNGANVGSNSTTYSNAALVNGDIVTCVLTSNATCATGNPATSNSLSMTVNPNLPVSVSIAAGPAGVICVGTSVTFTATPTNGGASPSYQWKKNGTNVGSNSSTYTDAALANGDLITCVLTSNATCATGNPATSNTITMSVTPSAPVSVSIAANPAGTICSGANVVFTATPTNGGTTPAYQWTLNGSNVGSNSTTYSSTTLTNGDVITCILTSNATCATGNPATSNTITQSVSASVTWLGGVSSDWNNAANWCGAIPTSSIDVVIASGVPNYPQITAPGGACKNLTINAGASLSFSGTNTLTIAGNYSNSGTLTPGSGTITLNGTSAQTLIKTGGETFTNLSFSGAGTKTLLSAITVNGNITIDNTSGALNANNFAITVSGNWSNTGAAVIPGIQTTTFNGTTQSISRTGGETFSTVVFSNSGTKTIASDISLTGALTINAGVTLDAGAGANNISLMKNWVNNGTFTAQQGMVTFNGTTAQTIGGSSSAIFYNLTCNNTHASGVKLNTNQSAINIVNIQSGPLDLTTNTLTLLSTATGTALIDKLTGASADLIGNNLQVQRYIGGQTGWHQLASPVTGTTIGDWADDFYTTGFPGSNDPSYYFCSVYYYDETAPYPILDSGWVMPTGLSDPVGNTGYICYIGPGPTLVNVKGPHPSKAGVNIPITNTNTGTPSVDGWNSVANPYPAPINWDNAVLTPDINTQIQIWNDAAQQYGVYVMGTGGTGTNGVTNVIASSQAFWVYCTASTTLGLTENIKTTASTTYLKQSSAVNGALSANTHQIKLTINGNAYSDEALINFANGATEGYDVNFDASKFYSFNTSVPSINSVINDTSGVIDLAINSLPDTTQSMVIPVRATTGMSGTFTINAKFIGNIAPSSCLILEDLTTSTFTMLNGDNSYTFDMADTTQAVRFLLHIGAPISTSSIQPTCAGLANGSAIAKGIGNGPFDYIWTDQNDVIVKSVYGSMGADTLKNSASGTYSVTIDGNTGGCPQLTDHIIIAQADSIKANVTTVGVSCSTMTNGTANAANISNGVAPYSYLWSTGDTTATISNLAVGNYQLTLSDSNNCQSHFAVTISAVNIPITVSTSSPICSGQLNGFIIAEGIGTGPFDYTWTNANNIIVRSVTNISGADTLSNIPAGDYEVSVNGNTGTCPQLTENILLPQTDSVITDIITTDVSCTTIQDGTISISNTSNGTGPYTYLWSNGATAQTLTTLAAGNYQLTITDNNNCLSHYNVNIGISNSVSAVILAPDTLTTGIDSIVYFDNDAQNAENYQWNFGDGSLVDFTEDPQHTYLSLGTYVIQLITSNNSCSDTVYHTLQVINNTTGIKANTVSDHSITLQSSIENSYLNIKLEQEEKIIVYIYDDLGNILDIPQQQTIKTGRIPLNLDRFDGGIYFIKCIYGNKSAGFKVMNAK